MFTDEVVILMAIEEAGESAQKPKRRPKSITGSHISYLCDSLVRHGYLAADSGGGRKLSSKGWDTILMEAILLVSCVDEARVKDRMQRLALLSNEINQHIDNPGEKPARVLS